MTTTSSLPVSTILRTVWDDLGELSVRLRSQSIIACASAVFFALIGAIPAISDNRMLAEVFDLMSTFVLVPFEIAICRLLISGEAASTAVSMSLAGSCFSSESAPGPFHHGIRGRGGTIYWAALPSHERQVQATKRTHLIHRPARDIFPPQGGTRVSSYRI